ncbi:hypothetical protein [uncultured Tateyamaria sp.]|uniref:hypothetical protein n=1 Tax=uncultured Tateyamaria sp. TaxID=455651 RepID=UPI00261C8ACC|nr:hypothetical protein [uncultured Tateyamaria sp.]
MDFSSLTLSPALATLIFCLTCLAGHRYRRVWKAEGPIYQYWVFGLLAASGLLILGFIPVDLPG